MEDLKAESKPKINRNSDRLPVPNKFRRIERAIKNRDIERRNDGQAKGHGHFNIIGVAVWGGQAIYTPPRKKFKGWQRENRKYKKTA